MRLIRVLVCVAVALSSVLFVGVSASSAQTTNSVTIVGQPTLALKGLAVNVTVDITCDPSLNIAFGSATVAQVSGHKVAAGSGFFENAFPGVPCTGRAQPVTFMVQTATSFAFKQGSALAAADVSLFDPVNGILTDITAGPVGVRITK